MKKISYIEKTIDYNTERAMNKDIELLRKKGFDIKKKYINCNKKMKYTVVAGKFL